MSGMEIDWKTEIPQPVFDEHPEWVDFYHEAWETIAGKLVDRPGFPQTPCMEAPSADGNTFRLSDACFLAMITKYARGSLPGVESLANFYHALYGPDPVPGLNISDQSSAPLFGWAEYENALLSGDTRHVRALLRSGYLQRHYEKLETLAQNIKNTALCGLGQTAPNPVLSTLRFFRDEYEAHIYEKRCPAGVCHKLLSYTIDPAKCKACGACFRLGCPSIVRGEPTANGRFLSRIEPAACIGCGLCAQVCPFGAIGSTASRT